MTSARPDPSTFLAALGERVRMRREALGMSQRELGRRAGMHHSFVAIVETGSRNASIVNLGRLARALDYDDMGQLMDGLSPP